VGRFFTENNLNHTLLLVRENERGRHHRHSVVVLVVTISTIRGCTYVVRGPHVVKSSVFVGTKRLRRSDHFRRERKGSDFRFASAGEDSFSAELVPPAENVPKRSPQVDLLRGRKLGWGILYRRL
jgi:hypothetical protein